MDGNSGYTAAVLETLCQSHVPNALTLLPALPAQWQSGQLLGVQGRGDVSIDMVWSAGKLTSLKLLFSSVHHPYWYSSEHYRSAVMKLVPKQAGLLTDDSKTIARFPVAVFSPNQLSLSARTSSECMVQWLPVDSKSSSQASNMVAAVLVVTIPTPSSRVCEVMLES
ncbi:hypothetical protein EON64_01595 [archaeon]|nr:MAG: hypothetical protein EON64_01595 [archaeon]